MSAHDFALFAELARTLIPEGAVGLALHHFYLDESGTHDGFPVMALSGYLFSATQAHRFSKNWSKELKRFGLPFSHMTDCAQGKGAYEDLSLEDRIDSEKALITNIKRHTIMSMSIVMDSTKYREAFAYNRRYIDVYSFCAISLIARLQDWLEENLPQAKVAYFFESGHRFQHQANIMMGGKRQPRNYLSHTFVDKRAALPLQAADMLAWQVAHFFKEMPSKRPMRKDFQAMLRPNRDKLVLAEDSVLEEFAYLNEALDYGMYGLADYIVESRKKRETDPSTPPLVRPILLPRNETLGEYFQRGEKFRKRRF